MSRVGQLRVRRYTQEAKKFRLTCPGVSGAFMSGLDDIVNGSILKQRHGESISDGRLLNDGVKSYLGSVRETFL